MKNYYRSFRERCETGKARGHIEKGLCAISEQKRRSWITALIISIIGGLIVALIIALILP